jgi:hypothetical protein
LFAIFVGICVYNISHGFRSRKLICKDSPGCKPICFLRRKAQSGVRNRTKIPIQGKLGNANALNNRPNWGWALAPHKPPGRNSCGRDRQLHERRTRDEVGAAGVDLTPLCLALPCAQPPHKNQKIVPLKPRTFIVAQKRCNGIASKHIPISKTLPKDKFNISVRTQFCRMLSPSPLAAIAGPIPHPAADYG